jgi:hypothetical protein
MKTPLQRDIIAILLLIGLIAAGNHYARPYFARGEEAHARLPAIRARLENARTTISRHDEIRKSLDAELLVSRKFEIEAIAPMDDPLSWAQKEISSRIGMTNLKLLNLGFASEPLPQAKGTNAPYFRPFQVMLELAGTPQDTVLLVRALEELNPWLQIHELSIMTPRPPSPPVLMMTVEWPIACDTDKAALAASWHAGGQR